MPGSGQRFFRIPHHPIHPLTADTSGLGGWHVSLAATLAGHAFSDVRIDVVQRVEEIQGGTELIELTLPATAAGFAPVSISAVDIAQHAAEKSQALSRTCSGYRPSSRVKDLLDTALIAQGGLLPDPRLPARLITVFLAGGATALPTALPDPSASPPTGLAPLPRTA